MQAELIRSATVSAKSVDLGKKGSSVIIDVDGKHTHTFDPKSRISLALDHMPLQDLEKRLNGGHYFFIDDQLVDFRDSQYNGFVHSDDSISKLMETIGVSPAQTNRRRQMARATGDSTISSKIALRNQWSKQEISVPMYQDGGNFNSQLSFLWNPFHSNVRSVFELVRLICTNGMVGLTSFLNASVPVVNKWEEHLEIASRQIQNKVSDKVQARLVEMGVERASVADLLLISRHALTRLADGTVADSGQRERLRNIVRITDPTIHLGKHYAGDVFKNQAIARQVPGHLTTFDAWNITTEMSSHTDANAKSSDVGLQKLANELVFEPSKSFLTDRVTAPIRPSFIDHEAAFIGDIH